MPKPTKVFHPIFFAAFPVIFLYSHNIGEVTLSETMLPFAVCLACGFLVWGATFAIFKDKLKSGLLTSLILIYFFSYGHFFSFFEGRQIGGFKFGIHTYMLVVWTLVWALPLFWIFKTKRNFDVLTKILNIFAVCLVTISLGNIAVFHFKSTIRSPGTEISQLPDKKASVEPGKLENMPDIYYIILDEHARADILKEEFDYDNSAFISHLKDNDFFVSENSRSNYIQTPLSIASSINFRYLNDLTEIYGSNSIDLRPVRNLISNNRVLSFLKEIGYTTVCFSSGFNFTELTTSDHYLSETLTGNSFVNELLDSTCLIAVKKLSKNIHYGNYKRLKYTFDKMAETAKIKSPHFVFAHILSPHTPYVFDENGDFKVQSGTFDLDNSSVEVREQKREYLAQLKYTDKRISQAIDDILTKSKQKPIIIIQGDHGIRWKLRDKSDKSVGTSRNDYHFATLMALHLPGFDYSKLDNNITPVNTFRFIFNHYFGTEFEILENKNFRCDPPHFYKFSDVTKDLHGRQ